MRYHPYYEQSLLLAQLNERLFTNTRTELLLCLQSKVPATTIKKLHARLNGVNSERVYQITPGNTNLQLQTSFSSPAPAINTLLVTYSSEQSSMHQKSNNIPLNHNYLRTHRAVADILYSEL